jgi:hypothetical protein
MLLHLPFAWLRTPNWHATPLGQSVVDEVAAVSAVSGVVADDYLPEALVGEEETPLDQNVTVRRRRVAAAPVVADFDDDDYLSEDADDNYEVAVQDDEMVEEEPVAIVIIVAPPLRRSKRVAAQQCKALRSAVAPNPYAMTGLRRSERLAGKTRVNYKY